MALSAIQRAYHYLFLNKVKLDKLDKEQRELTEINVKKHNLIFWCMILTGIYSFFIIKQYYNNQIDTVLTSLLGVLFISGGAWFAITFGRIPHWLEDFAVEITLYLFFAFAVALAAVFSAASLAVPLLSPVLFLAFITLYAASVKYDIADALNIGIDEAMYEHAKIGKKYFITELSEKELKKGVTNQKVIKKK